MFTIEYLRSFKIGSYAIFDFAASFIGMYYLAPLLSKIFRLAHLNIPQISWLYWTLPLSVLVHILVGKYTPLTENFLDLTNYYFIKIFIIGLFLFGLRGIKINN